MDARQHSFWTFTIAFLAFASLFLSSPADSQTQTAQRTATDREHISGVAITLIPSR